MLDNLQINDPVNVLRPPKQRNQPTLEGIVAYLGPVKFGDRGNDWVGVRLTGTSTGQGKNDGSVQGERYFHCPDKYGVFVRKNKIKKRTNMSRVEALRLKRELALIKKEGISNNNTKNVATTTTTSSSGSTSLSSPFSSPLPTSSSSPRKLVTPATAPPAITNNNNSKSLDSIFDDDDDDNDEGLDKFNIDMQDTPPKTKKVIVQNVPSNNNATNNNNNNNNNRYPIVTLTNNDNATEISMLSDPPTHYPSQASPHDGTPPSPTSSILKEQINELLSQVTDLQSNLDHVSAKLKNNTNTSSSKEDSIAANENNNNNTTTGRRGSASSSSIEDLRSMSAEENNNNNYNESHLSKVEQPKSTEVNAAAAAPSNITVIKTPTRKNSIVRESNKDSDTVEKIIMVSSTYADESSKTINATNTSAKYTPSLQDEQENEKKEEEPTIAKVPSIYRPVIEYQRQEQKQEEQEEPFDIVVDPFGAGGKNDYFHTNKGIPSCKKATASSSKSTTSLTTASMTTTTSASPSSLERQQQPQQQAAHDNNQNQNQNDNDQILSTSTREIEVQTAAANAAVAAFVHNEQPKTTTTPRGTLLRDFSNATTSTASKASTTPSTQDVVFTPGGIAITREDTSFFSGRRHSTTTTATSSSSNDNNNTNKEIDFSPPNILRDFGVDIKSKPQSSSSSGIFPKTNPKDSSKSTFLLRDLDSQKTITVVATTSPEKKKNNFSAVPSPPRSMFENMKKHEEGSVFVPQPSSGENTNKEIKFETTALERKASTNSAVSTVGREFVPQKKVFGESSEIKFETTPLERKASTNNSNVSKKQQDSKNSGNHQGSTLQIKTMSFLQKVEHLLGSGEKKVEKSPTTSHGDIVAAPTVSSLDKKSENSTPLSSSSKNGDIFVAPSPPLSNNKKFSSPITQRKQEQQQQQKTKIDLMDIMGKEFFGDSESSSENSNTLSAVPEEDDDNEDENAASNEEKKDNDEDRVVANNKSNDTNFQLLQSKLGMKERETLRLQSQLKELESKLETTEKKRVELESQVKDLHSQMTEKEDERVRLQSQVQEEEERKKKKEEDESIAILINEKLIKLQCKYAEKVKENSQLQLQYSDLQALTTTRNSTHTSTIQKAEAVITQLQAQLTEVTETLDHREEEIQILHKSLSKAEANAKEQMKTINDLEKKQITLKQKLLSEAASASLSSSPSSSPRKGEEEEGNGEMDSTASEEEHVKRRQQQPGEQGQEEIQEEHDQELLKDQLAEAQMALAVERDARSSVMSAHKAVKDELSQMEEDSRAHRMASNEEKIRHLKQIRDLKLMNERLSAEKSELEHFIQQSQRAPSTASSEATQQPTPPPSKRKSFFHRKKRKNNNHDKSNNNIVGGEFPSPTSGESVAEKSPPWGGSIMSNNSNDNNNDYHRQSGEI